MSRFLVITKGYFGLTAPNSICLKDIVKIWKDKNIDVDIISVENQMVTSNEICTCVHSSTLEGKFRKIKKVFTYPIDDTMLIKKLVLEIEKKVAIIKYDLVIAIVNPPESASALKIIKEKYPQIKCCLYEMDAISNRYKFQKTIFEKIATILGIKWAKSIYAEMDYIIHMKSHRSHFEKKEFSNYATKTIYLDIPALKVDYWNKPVDEKNITLLYAGAFYKGLRDPERVIKILLRLSELRNISINMYINAAMIEDVKMFSKENKSVKVSNYIPEKELQEKILDTTCLLSVGNKESDFLPSKVLAYMGTGKPIIHFYFDEYDVALSYLKKYKNALCLRINDSIEKNVDRIIYFFENEMNRNVLGRNELLQCFVENTPTFNANRIIQLIE